MCKCFLKKSINRTSLIRFILITDINMKMYLHILQKKFYTILSIFGFLFDKIRETKLIIKDLIKIKNLLLRSLGTTKSRLPKTATIRNRRMNHTNRSGFIVHGWGRNNLGGGHLLHRLKSFFFLGLIDIRCWTSIGGNL